MKKITLKKLDVCNICGKDLDFFDQQEDFSICKHVGYGSVHDGDNVELRICCKCFDQIVMSCVVCPIESEE